MKWLVFLRTLIYFMMLKLKNGGCSPELIRMATRHLCLSQIVGKKTIQIAGPVTHNSTGTSIHKTGNRHYCFLGSKEREIFIYTYPNLKESGTLQMDLPLWTETSVTRVWPNEINRQQASNKKSRQRNSSCWLFYAMLYSYYFAELIASIYLPVQ